MKIIRKNFAVDFTGGELWSNEFDSPLYTLEQEWRPTATRPGGASSNSCVPNGTYLLTPFRRPGGIIVPMLTNPNLKVYASAADLPPEGGRFLILMHPGNTVKDVVGCICSGLWKQEPHSVNDSRNAQALIMQAFNEGDKELIIESFETLETYLKKGD